MFNFWSEHIPDLPKRAKAIRIPVLLSSGCYYVDISVMVRTNAPIEITVMTVEAFQLLWNERSRPWNVPPAARRGAQWGGAPAEGVLAGEGGRGGRGGPRNGFPYK